MVLGGARTGGRRVDGHVVRGVVQELGARVALNVVAVIVAPAQLHVHPVSVHKGASVKNAFLTCNQQADVRMCSHTSAVLEQAGRRKNANGVKVMLPHRTPANPLESTFTNTSFAQKAKLAWPW